MLKVHVIGRSIVVENLSFLKLGSRRNPQRILFKNYTEKGRSNAGGLKRLFCAIKMSKLWEQQNHVTSHEK